MKVEDFLEIVRFRVNDKLSVAYSDDELMQFLNDSIALLNTELITLKDPVMLKEITISQSMAMPANFVKFAGKYPVYIADDTIKMLGTDSIPNVLYFANKSKVSSLNDEVPFSDTEESMLVQLTVIYALNKNEYSTDQDELLLDKLREIIRAVKGG